MRLLYQTWSLYSRCLFLKTHAFTLSWSSQLDSHHQTWLIPLRSRRNSIHLSFGKGLLTSSHSTSCHYMTEFPALCRGLPWTRGSFRCLSKRGSTKNENQNSKNWLGGIEYRDGLFSTQHLYHYRTVGKQCPTQRSKEKWYLTFYDAVTSKVPSRFRARQ